MERGRRIIYDMTDGKIVADLGEASGDVLPYPEIGASTSLRYLDLPYGQDADKFARVKAYHVDHATKTVVFDVLGEEMLTYGELLAENELLRTENVTLKKG